MGFENESIIGYLEGGCEELNIYFAECKVENKLPNYSEFCRKYLNGETKEGISFTSIKVRRKYVTDFIRKKYKLWLELQ